MTVLDERRINELRQALDLVRIEAILGDANGQIDDDPVNRPGYWRVRYKTAGGYSLPPVVRMGMNVAVPKTPGQPVYLGYEGNELVIKGANVRGQIQAGINPAYNNAAKLPEKTFIPTSAIVPLSSGPTSPESSSVWVSSLLYLEDRTVKHFHASEDDGTGTPKGKKSLSSSVPTAGNHRLAALWLKTDQTVEVTTSTTQPMDQPLDLTDLQECLDASSVGSEPSFVYRLKNNESTITDADIWLDLRQIVNNRRAPALRSTCQGRLTLTTGTPITTSDVTAATTLYFTPYAGNQIALYDGSTWKLYAFSEVSIAVPSTTNTPYDIFIYDNAGTLTLDSVAWNSPTNGAITNATNATPIVVTYTGTDPANDQEVTIVGVLGNTAANGTWRIANINTGAKTFELTTFAGVNSVGNGAYTSGGTWQRADQNTARATALATQDGVKVKSGATSRRYLGAIRTTTTSGQCEDSRARHFVDNYYNQVARLFNVNDATGSWTLTSGVFRPTNNDLTNRVQLLIGVSEQPIYLKHEINSRVSATTAAARIALSLDAPATVSSMQDLILNGPAVFTNSLITVYTPLLTDGYHFIQAIEYGLTTATFFGGTGMGYEGFAWQ